MDRELFQKKMQFALAIFASTLAFAVHAHNGTGLPGGFVPGFMHPFSGFDHLLAMVSVGIWGAFLGRPLIYALPVAFPLMMVVGALFGMFDVELPVPRIESGIALSVIVLGGCIALAVRARASVALVVIAVFAIFHGYAHGMMLPSAADPIGYSLGFVLATGLLHIAGIAIGLLNRWPSGVIATRTIGGAIALTGAYLLRVALAIG